MTTWWLRVWDGLRSSFWFLPTIFGVGGALLAALFMWGDHLLSPDEDGPFDWLMLSDAESARTLLSAILTAIIPVMTVVLSITVVALTLASSQFGPRMLRTFMQDRGTQAVMGVFVGTGVYCTLVLGMTGRFGDAVAAPHVASLGAVLLALVSLGVLVYFIHHIACSIQAPYVIAAVGRDIDMAIHRWFPNELTDAELLAAATHPQQRPDPPRPVDEAFTIASADMGYLQTIDYDAIAALAAERDLVVHLPLRAGDVVYRGQAVAHVWPRERVDDQLARRVRRNMVTGRYRTPTQDVEFAIDQLVEIAVRALSPSLNDPVTAANCVDRLAQGLCSLAGRRISTTEIRDASGEVRLIVACSSFRGMVDGAFDKIRQHGRRDVAVTLRLLEAIGRIAPSVRTAEQRAALRRQADMIHRGAHEVFDEEEDRHAATRRYRAAIDALR
jgi:uncharacterized membrane protein